MPMPPDQRAQLRAAAVGRLLLLLALLVLLALLLLLRFALLAFLLTLGFLLLLALGALLGFLLALGLLLLALLLHVAFALGGALAGGVVGFEPGVAALRGWRITPGRRFALAVALGLLAGGIIARCGGPVCA